MKKRLIPYFCIGIFFWSISMLHAHAATILLSPSKETVDQGEEFYVDVLVDAQNESINGLQGSIVYSPNLIFIRAEDGNSIVNPWVDRPKQVAGAVTFSGIIPNGFDGLIDPFQSHTRKPGAVLRLVFSGTAEGEGSIVSTSIIATKNDGRGTVIFIPDERTTVSISDKTNTKAYIPADTQNPELIATIERDPKLYNGHATLVFTALDKESGIARVEVQEGAHPFKTVESPYELTDQTRSSVVRVRAIDTAGNVTTVVIEPTYTQTSFGYILGALLALLLVLILSYVVRRKIQNKNTS